MQEHGGFSTRPPVGRRGRERRMRCPRRPGAKHADSDGWGARMRAATPRTQVGEGEAPPACAASGPPGAESMRAQAPQPEGTERPKRANRRPGGIWPGRAGCGRRPSRSCGTRGKAPGGGRARPVAGRRSRAPTSPWRTALREGEEARKWPARQPSGAARSARAPSRDRPPRWANGRRRAKMRIAGFGWQLFRRLNVWYRKGRQTRHEHLLPLNSLTEFSIINTKRIKYPYHRYIYTCLMKIM